MKIPQWASGRLRRIVFGGEELAAKVDFGLRDPQREVDVWLHGLGDRIDVTQSHLIASFAPLTLCIGFAEKEFSDAAISGGRLELRFEQHGGEQYLLGVIGLRFVSSFRVGARRLFLFQMTHHKNRCLPSLQLWARYMRAARYSKRWKDPGVPVTVQEERAMAVHYCCPRPIALVTVVVAEGANLFPMNLMGRVGEGYFAFALNSTRAAPLVERAGRVVVSSVPLNRGGLMPKLGSNHRKSSIDWSQLPFETMRLEGIDGLVPCFAQRVRELVIEEVRPLGSHTLFIARIAADVALGDELQLFHVHGTYRAWLDSRA
jgi:flavin reductase (DIM6/NTAB) family NADH-FMN oxidoreductase RutF